MVIDPDQCSSDVQSFCQKDGSWHFTPASYHVLALTHSVDMEDTLPMNNKIILFINSAKEVRFYEVWSMTQKRRQYI